MNYAVVIPARFESSRLPGKPLIPLCGVPMILRTYRQCVKACAPERVFVATDDERVQAVCKSNHVPVLMTSGSCLTGTDRVAECARHLEADVFLNVQGDEPVFEPGDLSRLIEAVSQYPGEVINGFCELGDERRFRSGAVPKVVLRPDGRLLYMSRAPIPTTKSQALVQAWRQVCAYAFPRKALEAFGATARKTPLEQIEDIEILRFLEIGWEVRMVRLSDWSLAVDTPEDVARVEEAIRARGL